MDFIKKQMQFGFLFFVLVLFSTHHSNLPVYAQEITQSSDPQDNTDYIKGRPLTPKEIAAQKALEPTSLDYQDDGYKTSSITEDSSITSAVLSSINDFVLSSTLPAAYDLRNYNRITPVKNQNPYGSCWAFATVSAAESNRITDNVSSSSFDFSELQLSYYTYNKAGDPLGGTDGDKILLSSEYDFLDGGGNCYLSTFALADWQGLINESLAPYTSAFPSMTLADSLAYENDAAHLQNTYWISMTDMNVVKQMIINYGSAAVSYYHNNYFLNYNYAAYYNNLYTYSNHAVSIVGWDDSYPRTNFGNPTGSQALPTNNGAWLIKNSWGSGWGDSGYFWISYQDRSVLDSDAFIFDFEDADNYDNNYQYDGSASIQAYTPYNQGYMANVFTAQNNETLEAVSFYTLDPNTSYRIEVYTNMTSATNPTSGTRAFTTSQTGELSFSGYHTIPLNQTIALKPGEKFSIVIKLEKQNDQVSLLYDGNDSWGWVSFTSISSIGQSFYSSSGTTWNDISKYGDENFRIKAFTSDIIGISDPTITSAPIENPPYTDEEVIPTPIPTPTPTELQDDANTELIPISTSSITRISNIVYTGKTIRPTVTVKQGTKKLTLGTDYSVYYRNNKSTGLATIQILGKGRYIGTKKVTFHIVPKRVKLRSIKSLKTKTATLSWYKSTGASGYQIAYSTRKSGRYKSIAITKKLSYLKKNLKKGKTYYFKVRAFKTVNKKNQYGAYSKIKSIKIK